MIFSTYNGIIRLPNLGSIANPHQSLLIMKDVHKLTAFLEALITIGYAYKYLSFYLIYPLMYLTHLEAVGQLNRDPDLQPLRDFCRQ